MKYKPFEQGYFKHEMGLKNLDLHQWIEIDELWKEQLALKSKLLREERDRVLRTLPSADAASQELMEKVAKHIVEYYPEKFETKNDKLKIKELNQEFNLKNPTDHPLAVLAQWVQEDFCLMNTSQDKEAKLEAGCVCFPSRWKLIDKVGHNMAGIHTPVPNFNKNLERPATRFLLNTVEDKPMWRMNWTIHASNNLFAYGPSTHTVEVTPENVLEKTFFRTERQTLRRLTKSQYVVFSIRTYITPLTEIAAIETDRANLLKSLETMPQEIAEYRGMGALIESLKTALSVTA